MKAVVAIKQIKERRANPNESQNEEIIGRPVAEEIKSQEKATDEILREEAQ